MTINVAINGFGRIGRNILRAHYESGNRHGLRFVALNDLGDARTNAHLLKYDTVHGPFKGSVDVEGEYLVVNGDRILVVAQRDPAKLPWKSLAVDVVHECTGIFSSKAKASALIEDPTDGIIIVDPPPVREDKDNDKDDDKERKRNRQ